MASTYGSHSPVSTDVYYSQIPHKMPNLGCCTLSTQEMGWCTYKKRQPLLLKFVVPFLRCIRKVRGASDSIYKSHIGHINIFFSRPTFKLHENCQIWGRVASLCMGEWVIYYNDRYPLLMNWFKMQKLSLLLMHRYIGERHWGRGGMIYLPICNAFADDCANLTWTRKTSNTLQESKAKQQETQWHTESYGEG